MTCPLFASDWPPGCPLYAILKIRISGYHQGCKQRTITGYFIDEFMLRCKLFHSADGRFSNANMGDSSIDSARRSIPLMCSRRLPPCSHQSLLVCACLRLTPIQLGSIPCVSCPFAPAFRRPTHEASCPASLRWLYRNPFRTAFSGTVAPGKEPLLTARFFQGIDLQRLMLLLFRDAHVADLHNLFLLPQVSHQPPDLLRFVKGKSYARGGGAPRL